MSCGCYSHNGLVRSPEGLAQRKSLRSTGLTDRDFFAILDRSGSVSVLIEIEENFVYDRLHTELNHRFIHGS